MAKIEKKPFRRLQNPVGQRYKDWYSKPLVPATQAIEPATSAVDLLLGPDAVRRSSLTLLAQRVVSRICRIRHGCGWWQPAAQWPRCLQYWAVQSAHS